MRQFANVARDGAEKIVLSAYVRMIALDMASASTSSASAMLLLVASIAARPNAQTIAQDMERVTMEPASVRVTSVDTTARCWSASQTARMPDTVMMVDATAFPDMRAIIAKLARARTVAPTMESARTISRASVMLDGPVLTAL